jgi:hypothetical protein
MPGSLTKDLPYWDIYRDVMVLSDGRLVPVLKLELPQSDLKSNEELTRCNDLIAQMLRYGVAENEVLSLAIHTHRNTLDITKTYESQRTTHEEIAEAITEDRVKHFQKLQISGHLFQHEMYVSSWKKAKPSNAKKSFLRREIDKALGRKSHYQSFSKAEIVRRRTRTLKGREVLARHLREAGFNPHAPSSQEIFEAAYRYFNPGSFIPTFEPPDSQAFYPRGVLEQFPELSPNTLRRQLIGSDLDNNPYDHLWLSGHYLVGLTMEKLPDDYTYPDMVQRSSPFPARSG